MDFPGYVTCHAYCFYLFWSKITPLLKDWIELNLCFIYDYEYKVYGTDWGFSKLIIVLSKLWRFHFRGRLGWVENIELLLSNKIFWNFLINLLWL